MDSANEELVVEDFAGGKLAEVIILAGSLGAEMGYDCGLARPDGGNDDDATVLPATALLLPRHAIVRTKINA